MLKHFPGMKSLLLKQNRQQKHFCPRNWIPSQAQVELRVQVNAESSPPDIIQGQLCRSFILTSAAQNLNCNDTILHNL